ncbi:MAG: glycosyltransferase [Actinomycetota bacterium]|nr:glycosyltransferase [Actinomycetota bacterium]
MSDPSVRVSVCLAAHNGGAHIAAQLESVLSQLARDDEVVVVDDASTDETVDIVQATGDPRVRVHRNETNRGYVRTFERAIELSRGDVVLLCDQDDVWVPGRVEAMVSALREHGVVATSVSVLGEPLEPPRWPLRTRDSGRRLLNLALVLVGVRWYFGCAMGLRRDVLDVALPIPDFVHESHDLWFAVVGNVLGEMGHLERPSVQRRLHAANQTPEHWRSLRLILRSRWMLARAVWVAVGRRSPQRS